MFWHARTISKFLLKRPELQRDTLENGLSHSKTVSKNTAPGNNPWAPSFLCCNLAKNRSVHTVE